MLEARDLQNLDRAATVASIFNRGPYLELLVDSVPAWLSYIGRDRRYRFANKRYNDAFGWSGTDIVGKAVWEVIPDDLYRFVEPYLDQALAGHHVSFEGSLTTQDGENVHYKAEYIPDLTNGVVNGVFALIADITTQKNSEKTVIKAHANLMHRFGERSEQLKESERRFHRIFEDSQLGMVLITPDRRIIDVNRAFCTMLEYPKNELKRLSMAEMTHPDDIEASDRLLRQVFSDSPRKRRMEKRYISKSGKVIWANVTLSPIRDDHGTHLYSVGMIEDITEVKQATNSLVAAQEQLKSFLDNSPDGIVMMDLNGRFIIVNRAYENWHGIAVSDLIGKSSYELYPKEIADRVTAQDREVLAAGQALKFENELPFQDGTRRILEQVKFPLYDGTGEVIGLGAVNRDVTQSRQAEAALQTSQRMESLGRLTGGVAHDFNNLLTIIIGNLEMVIDANTSDWEFHAPVNSAISAADKGSALVQRLLSFSRDQTLKPKVVSIKSLIDEMKDMVRQSLSEAITCEFDIPDDVWPILVDVGQLENALLNLAVNSGDAMPKGGIFRIAASNVHVGGDSCEDPAKPGADEYVQLRVSDTGEGMAPETAARILEPFFTTKEPGKGTGLGLSTVYGFVQQSGGDLKIDSAIGEGTSVCIFFPRATGDNSTDADNAMTASAPRGNGKLVLIVEDDPALRALVASQVSALDYNVVDVKDGAEAAAFAAGEQPIDLLLTDMVLPNGMDGPAVAETVKSHQPLVKVLYMSGYGANGAINKSVGADETIIIQKPFRTSELAQAMATALADS